jgi:hypothetical protein
MTSPIFFPEGGVPTHTLIIMQLKKASCGDLVTLLADGQTSRAYCFTLVQLLYISCYASLNKLVLSYLSLCLLPQWWPRSGCTFCHRWALSPISVISYIGLSLISERLISDCLISDWRAQSTTFCRISE